MCPAGQRANGHGGVDTGLNDQGEEERIVVRVRLPGAWAADHGQWPLEQPGA
jgi:hypothetical protein